MLIFLRKKSNFAKKVGKFRNRVYNTISECDGKEFFLYGNLSLSDSYHEQEKFGQNRCRENLISGR